MLLEPDIADPEIQKKVMSLNSLLIKVPGVIQAQSWFADFILWIRMSSNYFSEYNANGYSVPREKFIPWLNEFLNDTVNGGKCYHIAFPINHSNNSIEVSQFILSTKVNPNDVFQTFLMMKEIKGAVDSLHLNGHLVGPYSFIYTVFDRFMEKFVVVTVLFAFIIFASMFIMYRDWRCSLCAITCIALATFTYVGLLALCDVDLNSISLSNIIVSICISVDMFSYFTNAYQQGKKDENYSFQLSLFASAAKGMGVSMVGSFLSATCLKMSTSPFVQIYFFIMYSLMLPLVFCFAAFLYPVLLTWGDKPMLQAIPGIQKSSDIELR